MEMLTWGQILPAVAMRFWPVWIALIATFALSITFKRKLALYGKLFDSPFSAAAHQQTTPRPDSSLFVVDRDAIRRAGVVARHPASIH